MNRSIRVDIPANSAHHSLSGGADGPAFQTACTVILGVTLLLASVQPAGAAAPVPNPTVIGPVPAPVPPGDPSHDYPFYSTTVNLASEGYIEEEYFFEGAANRYHTPPLTTASVIDSGHPYRTRMVVRRPASPVKFNGTAILEWQNVTAGHDADAVWAGTQEHLLRRGYAWVGVSAQRVGVHGGTAGLKAWSPGRYRTLDLTHDGTIQDDALCYDVFSQAAQAVRSPSGIDPMGGLLVERVFAIGASQSAHRLVSYHNSIHPLAGVLDAFVLTVGGGRLRTDLGVKVFQILSETDVARGAIRQPDSDHFRRWEVAGTAHLDYYLRQQLAPLKRRDRMAASSAARCDLPPFSRIPFHFAGNAAIDHLVRWVKDNISPPVAPEIRIAESGPPIVIARDGSGNALGGIRLPQHEVPTAANTGVNSGPGFCRVFGSYQPFDDAALRARYRDHETYVLQVIQVALDDVAAGFMVAADAQSTIRDALASGIGGPSAPCTPGNPRSGVASDQRGE
ncbi:MAG: alpha/beta hydrolase domain-containing protein [Bryobacteraceae bacterium]